MIEQFRIIQLSNSRPLNTPKRLAAGASEFSVLSLESAILSIPPSLYIEDILVLQIPVPPRLKSSLWPSTNRDTAFFDNCFSSPHPRSMCQIPWHSSNTCRQSLSVLQRRAASMLGANAHFPTATDSTTYVNPSRTFAPAAPEPLWVSRKQRRLILRNDPFQDELSCLVKMLHDSAHRFGL